MLMKETKKRNVIFMVLEIIFVFYIVLYLYFTFKGNVDVNFVVFFILMSLFILLRMFKTKIKSNFIIFLIYIIAAITIFYNGNAD